MTQRAALLLTISTMLLFLAVSGCHTVEKLLIPSNPALRTPASFTRPIRKPHFNGQFYFSPRKAHTFSLNLTRLIQTPVNGDNGRLFLAQSTDCHRKSTLLMRTLHYQLYVVTNLSFLKVKKSSFHVPSATVHRIR